MAQQGYAVMNQVGLGMFPASDSKQEPGADYYDAEQSMSFRKALF